MVFVAEFFGAIIAVFLVSRLLLIGSEKTVRQRIIADCIAAGIAVIAGAFGAADGGPPAYGWSVTTYIPAGGFVAGLDLIRSSRKRGAA